MSQTKSKSIKILNVISTRQTINYSTNIINIPFKGTTREKKTFSFQTEQRALPRHHVLYKVASNVTNKFPIHLNSYQAELNWTCSIFVQWTSRVEFYEFHVTAFFISFLFYNFLNSRSKWRNSTQISQVIEWMMKGILIWNTVWRRNCRWKNCDNLEEKNVFALCLNGIYVRMTLTGITMCVIKTTGILSNFFAFFRHCTDIFWLSLREAVKYWNDDLLPIIDRQ